MADWLSDKQTNKWCAGFPANIVLIVQCVYKTQPQCHKKIHRNWISVTSTRMKLEANLWALILPPTQTSRTSYCKCSCDLSCLNCYKLAGVGPCCVTFCTSWTSLTHQWISHHVSVFVWCLSWSLELFAVNQHTMTPQTESGKAPRENKWESERDGERCGFLVLFLSFKP